MDQNIGFRFDIYERIHLPEGTLAIRDLEEIELTPYFQGIPGDEQTQLRGNLQLTAVYESILDGAGKQTFIHRIPVEISLPVRTNDVSSQDIQVQIDQFDVELVSNRSLNVTGILSLAGWEQNRSDLLNEEQDEFYAEHQADEGRLSEQQMNKPKKPKEQVVAEMMEQPVEELVEKPIEKPVEQPVAEAVEKPNEKPVESVVEQPIHKDDKADMPVEMFSENSTVNQLEQFNEEIMPIANVENVEAEQVVVPKQDMKVAIKPQQQEEMVESVVEDTPSQAVKPNNSLEWKRLFLIKEDTNQFKRLRLCIVQKDDTLQSIADRYSLQPREIALYNRLNEVDITEGQIIYIPKSNV